jgi:single-strand DNA-binding protein
MAASLNKVLLLGNLTRDPELRYVPSGTAVANFSIAVNRSYKDSTGEKKEDTSFIRIVVWGKMAEICGEYLTKGRSVLVEGRLKSRTWEGPDGQKRSALDVIAANVQFLGPKGERSEASQDRNKNNNAPGGYGDVASIDLDQEADAEDIPF